MSTVQIELPSTLTDLSTPSGQQALLSYLYRFAEQLNTALNSLDESNFTSAFGQQIDAVTEASDKATQIANMLGNGELAKTQSMLDLWNQLKDTITSTADYVTANFNSIVQQTKNEILSQVTADYVASDPNDASNIAFRETVSSMLEQTANDITAMFSDFVTVSDIDKDSINDLTLNFKTYIRFNSTGLEIGKIGDSASQIVTRLTNNQLQFCIAGTSTVLAYISNDRLHIAYAEIAMLSLGDDANGYVDFDMEADGLTIRWRS